VATHEKEVSFNGDCGAVEQSMRCQRTGRCAFPPGNRRQRRRRVTLWAGWLNATTCRCLAYGLHDPQEPGSGIPRLWSSLAHQHYRHSCSAILSVTGITRGKQLVVWWRQKESTGRWPVRTTLGPPRYTKLGGKCSADPAARGDEAILGYFLSLRSCNRSDGRRR